MLRQTLVTPHCHVGVRAEQKITISYKDEGGRETDRTVLPLALVYYPDATNIVAWCELRQDIRHFRAERVKASEATEQFFTGKGDRLRQAWMDAWTEKPRTQIVGQT